MPSRQRPPRAPLMAAARGDPWCFSGLCGCRLHSFLHPCWEVTSAVAVTSGAWIATLPGASENCLQRRGPQKGLAQEMGNPFSAQLDTYSQGSFGTVSLVRKLTVVRAVRGAGQGLSARVLPMGLAEWPCCRSSVVPASKPAPPGVAHGVGKHRKHPSLAVRTRKAFLRPLCFVRTPISRAKSLHSVVTKETL